MLYAEVLFWVITYTMSYLMIEVKRFIRSASETHYTHEAYSIQWCNHHFHMACLTHPITGFIVNTVNLVRLLQTVILLKNWKSPSACNVIQYITIQSHNVIRNVCFCIEQLQYVSLGKAIYSVITLRVLRKHSDLRYFSL